MSTLRDRIREWVSARGATADEPLREAIRHARFLEVRAAEAGRPVPPATAKAVDDAGTLAAAGKLSGAAEQEFFLAYGVLRELTADLSKRRRTRLEYPFEEALEDSELLLKYASESGLDVPPNVASAILGARTALKQNQIDDGIRAAFYANYSSLTKQLGDVTAATIRSCSRPTTRLRLGRDQIIAVTLAAAVALLSVTNFVGDRRSKLIDEAIAAENALAAKLRANLTPTANSPLPDPNIAGKPCSHITEPSATELKITTSAQVEELQQFAAVMREVRSMALKLNELVWRIPVLGAHECDPFGDLPGCGKMSLSEPELEAALQLNPGLINYTAEVLCKIRSYQSIRDFANNVNANYTAFFGAFTSFGLPILYALLGAFAFRLRLFGDTIRKHTYHPSYADSARLITAIIAGAICGLFNPAQGVALSPLAVAFLVGYAVEVFFRLLDNITSSLGAGTAPRPPASPTPTATSTR